MRLSEFKDEHAIEVVGRILEVLPTMIANEKVRDASKNGPAAFAVSLLKDTPREAMTLLAIVNDKDVSEFECNGVSVLKDIMDLITDPDFMELFGLQGQTSASSTSAPGSIEAEGASETSSPTARKGSSANKK